MTKRKKYENAEIELTLLNDECVLLVSSQGEKDDDTGFENSNW